MPNYSTPQEAAEGEASTSRPKGWKVYWKLFTSTFTISAFTFGGGFVIIPLLRKKFVEDLGWIQEQEMLDLAAIAQSSPGAIAVNAAILVGYRVAGIPGAMVTILGTVLPPLIILSGISLVYEWFRTNRWVAALLKGMQAGVAAVIADVVLTMGGDIVKAKKVIPIVVMALAFAATYFFSVNVILIILVCGLIGVLSVLLARNLRREEKGGDGQ